MEINIRQQLFFDLFSAYKRITKVEYGFTAFMNSVLDIDPETNLKERIDVHELDDEMISDATEMLMLEEIQFAALERIIELEEKYPKHMKKNKPYRKMYDEDGLLINPINRHNPHLHTNVSAKDRRIAKNDLKRANKDGSIDKQRKELTNVIKMEAAKIHDDKLKTGKYFLLFIIGLVVTIVSLLIYFL